MKCRLTLVMMIMICACNTQAFAQHDALTTDVRTDYHSIRDYFIRAAEKMPESDYGFKPTPEVRSFGQQIAHVADDQYNLCAPAKGDMREEAYRYIETTFSTKADLVAHLKAAFAYCDGAYDSLNDASAAKPSARPGKTNFEMLNRNLWHTWEHYGNIVVYLRMKGIVPPTSEPSKPIAAPVK
jgi:hypothetical protein